MQSNMSDQPAQKAPDTDKPPPPTRAQRLAAFGFLGAFGLTILTVLLTGLRVGAPAAGHVLHPAPPAAETTAPSERAGERPRSPGAELTPPAAAPPSADETPASEKASNENAAHDPDDRARKDSRADKGKSQDLPANDGR